MSDYLHDRVHFDVDGSIHLIDSQCNCDEFYCLFKEKYHAIHYAEYHKLRLINITNRIQNPHKLKYQARFKSLEINKFNYGYYE